VLLVQRTGWGKSAVYFIATRVLRYFGAGPTILVSPLLALMRNQILMVERAGVVARTINSENRDSWEEISGAMERDEVGPYRERGQGARGHPGPRDGLRQAGPRNASAYCSSPIASA
jgi:hypothetical protein